MNKILEEKIKDKVKELLKEYKVQYFMPNASKFGKRGVSDFICCFCGYYIAVETKSPSAAKLKDNGMSKLQLEFFENVRNAMGHCFCVYDDNTLKELNQCLDNLQVSFLNTIEFYTEDNETI